MVLPPILCMYCLSLQILVRPIATLWWNWVKVPRLAIYSRFPKASLKRRSSRDLKYFGVLLLVLSKCTFLLRTILFSMFFDNFFFQRGLVHDDGLDSVCQIFSCVGDKWIQYSALCLDFQWIWQLNFLNFFISVPTSASLASLLLSSFCTSVCTPSFLRSLCGKGNAMNPSHVNFPSS